jgi:hypothetical protein
VPAHYWVEDAGLDGAEDLGDQAEEAEVRGPIPLSPVAVKFGPLSLGEDVIYAAGWLGTLHSVSTLAPRVIRPLDANLHGPSPRLARTPGWGIDQHL